MTDTEVKTNTEVAGNTNRPSSVRNRNWIVTSFDENQFKFYENEAISYEIYQIETCPKSGRLHKQGYIELTEAKPLSWIRKLDTKAHWEPRKGTQNDAIKYCSKEESRKEGPFEMGTKKSQGKRNDLIEIKEKIDTKVPLRQIAEEHFGDYIRYHKGIERYIELTMEHRTDAPKVFWRWGLAGCGKTRYCVETHPNHYIKDSTQWWNGYNQQEAIIIDDFDGKWPYRDLLRLLDRYQYQGQTKGGYVKINSPYIYITCEFPPNHYWSGNELDQVTRRLENITEVKVG